MNDILRKSYDPVSVKLQPIDETKKSNTAKKTKKKNKKNKRKTNKKKTSNKKKVEDKLNSTTSSTELPEKVTPVDDNVSKPIEVKQTESPIVQNDAPVIKETEILKESVTEVVKVEKKDESEPRATKAKVPESTKAKPKPTPKPKPPTKTQKPKPKPPAKLTKIPTTTKKPVVVKKTKPVEKSKPRAKGILYGLSSLRRDGDVAVNIHSDHTTVKSNFAVGPLILKVEKEVGRGAKKELKSATATTAEMVGKLTLRVSNQGVATLHSIKVLQPKQVRVDSNHERTRELVWQRSARIAHVVSEKLLSASKPMFPKHHEKQE